MSTTKGTTITKRKRCQGCGDLYDRTTVHYVRLEKTLCSSCYTSETVK